MNRFILNENDRNHIKKLYMLKEAEVPQEMKSNKPDNTYEYYLQLYSDDPLVEEPGYMYFKKSGNRFESFEEKIDPNTGSKSIISTGYKLPFINELGFKMVDNKISKETNTIAKDSNVEAIKLTQPTQRNNNVVLFHDVQKDIPSLGYLMKNTFENNILNDMQRRGKASKPTNTGEVRYYEFITGSKEGDLVMVQKIKDAYKV